MADPVRGALCITCGARRGEREAAEAKILRYEAALYQIARPEYRGPRSRDQEAAWDALKAEGVIR
jgi:hypothetical protein